MKLVLAVYNSKYIHSSLAPWCLGAGLKQYAPFVKWKVLEGTINQPYLQLVEQILQEKPDLITFSVYIWNKEITLKAIKAIKQQLPNCKILLGGPEVSYNAKEVLEESPETEYILAGEGEETLPQLCNCLQQERDPLEDEIDGLCARVGQEILEKEPAILKLPAPDPYGKEYFQALQGRIAYIETTRGCPYRCAFCLSGRCGPVRCFDLEQTKAKIIKLAQSGTKTVKFIDRTFNAHPSRATEIWSWIAQEYGKSLPEGVCFHFEIAGDILKPEHFAVLEKMPLGAVQFEIGLQSFYEPTLEAIHRKTNCTRLKQNIQRLVQGKNIHIHIDLIAGLPLETFAIFAESFNTAFWLKPQMLQLGFLKLLHGADMREFSEEYPCRYEKKPPYQVVDTPWISKEELEQIHQVEDSTEKLYNSGRFLRTVQYLLQCTQLSPFAFFLKMAYPQHHSVNLEEYTAFIQQRAESFPQVDKNLLRDCLCMDRLESNGTGKLPLCLQIQDPKLKQYSNLLKRKFPLDKGAKRGIAVLYGQKKIAWVDYHVPANPITQRRQCNTIEIEQLIQPF